MFEKLIKVPQRPEKLSELFWELQEIAGEAVVPDHASSDELAKKDLMWVVVRYEVELMRPLLPGETLRLTTWALPFRHRMSQRCYMAYDEEENCVLKGAGIWTVVHFVTREMVSPEEYGIGFQGETTGYEPARPASPLRCSLQYSTDFLVTDEVLDRNVHMNNTRYFDVVQECCKNETSGMFLKSVRAVFANEARKDDLLRIQWGREDNRFFFLGEKENESCFQIGLEYAH